MSSSPTSAVVSVAKFCRKAGLAIRVFAVCARVELLLRRHDLSVTCSTLGIALLRSVSEGSAPVLSARRSEVLLAHMRATAWTCRRWPFGDTCLRRCLVLGALSRDLEPVLVIGTRRADGGVRAHSWLELHGHVVDISPDVVDPVEWSAFTEA